MKKITPATERKLMAVIEKTAELVGAGLSPNAAIVKAASEGQLRPGEIGLVVHAYNTGRTTRQRQDGNDLFEKAAEFDLADTATILETMYPTTVKTAAATQQANVISAEYSYSPRSMLDRKARCEKRANAGIDWRTINGQVITAPPPLPTDPNHRLKKAMANIDRLRKTAEEARRKMASAFDQLSEAFMNLTDYFRRPDAKPMPVVKEAVILLHGQKGEQLMDQLVKVTPALTKLANHRTGRSLLGHQSPQAYTSVDDLDCTAAPFDLIATVMTKISEYLTSKADHTDSLAQFEKEAGQSILPFVDPLVSPSVLGPSLTSTEKTGSFGLNDPLKMLGSYSLVSRTMTPLANKLKGPDDDSRLNKTVSALNDPAHESRLREINTQAMLQDLLLNDPVISGYDPHEVTNAFNDITQISPSVADQRMLMQNLLRKKLQQGQLDTFEQDQLLGFEDKLRRQYQPVAGSADASVI